MLKSENFDFLVSDDAHTAQLLWQEISYQRSEAMILDNKTWTDCNTPFRGRDECLTFRAWKTGLVGSGQLQKAQWDSMFPRDILLFEDLFVVDICPWVCGQ